MSSPCAHIVHPQMVSREGTDQPGRTSAALAPSSVPVEEHGVAEWLVYAQNLSEHLRFYGPDNQYRNQNWKAFLGNDVSAVLALAAVQNVDAYRNQLNGLLNKGIRQELGKQPVNEDNLKKAFAQVFSYVATLAWSLDKLWQRLPASVPLKATLQNLIQSKLALELQKLKAFHVAAEAEDLFDETEVPQWMILGEQLAPASQTLAQPFSVLWTSAAVVDAQIFGPTAPGETARKIYFAINHSFFAATLDQFLRVYARVVSDAQQQFQASLTSREDHAPQMTLLLAFLQLLLYNREHLNTLSARHLDFYYQEVLQLTRKPAQPSQAHVVVEMARHVTHEILPKGTLFQAGKDSRGQEVVFALTEDFVPNQARLTSFISMYQATEEDEQKKGTGVNLQKGWLYASPAAHSLDGTSKEPVPPEQGWPFFGNKQYRHGKLTQLAMPPATIGFAVASPLLYLTEGTRTITLKLFLTGAALSLEDYSAAIKAQVTTAEGWHPLSLISPYFCFQEECGNKLLVLKAKLQPDEPATAPFHPEIHQAAYDTAHPVLSVHIQPQPGKEYLYELVKDATLTKIELTVEGQGLRNLQLYNDFGMLDPAQPFMPFGPLPQKDASLIIGHPDVFLKRNATISALSINWKDKPSAVSTKPITIQSLQQGQWQTKTASADLFELPAISLSAEDQLPLEYGLRPDYTAASVKGFLRLKLNEDFGHRKYQKDLTDYLIDKAGGEAKAKKDAIQAILSSSAEAADKVSQIQTSLNTMAPAPTEPYTPVIEQIALDYSATATVDLTSKDSFLGRQVQFLHVYPYGQKEEHPALKRIDLRESSVLGLVPVFQRKNVEDPFFKVEEEDGSVKDWLTHEGEFYLGVEGATPPQTLSVLFQLVEGSANPQVKKPDQHVHWSYLAGNHWVSFQKEQVSDFTGQLTRSGIIRFQLPKAANHEHSLLPSGQVWLRAAVHTASEAVCRAVAVLPQAALVVFQDQGNAPDFLARHLPAGSISKLVEPLAGVKKVEQPFASFGGALAETPPHFYRRVSEHLRHKDRAITLWDYEHLVLEAFPRIYKVKCLPHTRYEPTGTTGIYNEKAPGHVTVVSIPDLRQRNAVDPLQPLTSVGELEEIKAFLRQRLSCFVTLHVRNPIFEQVKVKLEVSFFPQYDVSAYSQLLRQEITRFLSPWAYGQGQDLRFGGKIYKSTLIDFVEERPYVDFITQFQLYHLPGQGLPEQEVEEVRATKACSVLVSVPEEEHGITVLEEEPEELEKEKCGC
ncbi:baseplate J/gp47 family protein [Sabulibacter ruber]|uniref:baseplate J/gp47 family protein n=1 Tax=Sabulibacter ruber TaxID=2811901 RepID=UPI001A95DCC4|nr:baseplate J/gp47 family protein [Sabulibacter ruber]